MAVLTCVRCGTPYQREALTCLACGAWRQHPDAGPRPVAYRWEAMRHYSTRRRALLEHRASTDVLGLLLVGALAVGAVYVVHGAPPFDPAPWLDAIGRISYAER